MSAQVTIPDPIIHTDGQALWPLISIADMVGARARDLRKRKSIEPNLVKIGQDYLTRAGVMSALTTKRGSGPRLTHKAAHTAVNASIGRARKSAELAQEPSETSSCGRVAAIREQGPSHGVYSLTSETVSFAGAEVVIFLDGLTFWTPVRDVAEALEHSRGYRLHELAREDQIRKGPSGELLVNEHGLYRILMRTSAPKAEAFQDWLTDVVIPSIRRSGSYSTSTNPSPVVITPQLLRAMATQLEAAEAKALAEGRRADAAETVALTATRRADEARREAVTQGLRADSYERQTAVLLQGLADCRSAQSITGAAALLTSRIGNLPGSNFSVSRVDLGRKLREVDWTYQASRKSESRGESKFVRAHAHALERGYLIQDPDQEKVSGTGKRYMQPGAIRITPKGMRELARRYIAAMAVVGEAPLFEREEGESIH